ncbi:hypothetical protein CPB85DRAFT_1294953 [Mucidula mucida]|nr:hypothetical protein CPB85DRAFT_1294953 [Mucidula mucida]
MPPRVKPAPPPPETAPEPRKTTRQAAKLAVARIAASVQELESVADDEALAPPTKRRAVDYDDDLPRTKRTRTGSPPKLVQAYAQQPGAAAYPPPLPGQYPRVPSMNYEGRMPNGLTAPSQAGIRLPPPPITQLQSHVHAGGAGRSSYPARYSGQNGPAYYSGAYSEGRGHAANGVTAASYPQAHGGSSGYNTIQVNTHVNIYPNHMEGLPHDRDLAQTLPEPHQRADYLAYDSRPPPPYSASQNAARADPNQNISSARLQQLRAEYGQQFYGDGSPRRPDMQAAAGYQYYNGGGPAGEVWPQPQSGQASRSQPRSYQDPSVDQGGVSAYPHQGYSNNMPQNVGNGSEYMRRDSRGYSQIDQQYMLNEQVQQSMRRESQGYLQSAPYPQNTQAMRRESQSYMANDQQYASGGQYPPSMANTSAGGSRVLPSPTEYNNLQMTYPNQGYSRSNSISSASNLQSTPSPLSAGYDAVRAVRIQYAPESALTIFSGVHVCADTISVLTRRTPDPSRSKLV